MFFPENSLILGVRNYQRSSNKKIALLNLEFGHPTFPEAQRRLKSYIDTNNRMGMQKEKVVKVIHGYGSSDAGGGVLRARLRKYLAELVQSHSIKGYITGEDFRKNSVAGANLSKEYPFVVCDRDFGMENIGITIVILY